MKELVMPKPNPKQVKVAQAKNRHIAYGGARGGGKSFIVRWLAIIFALYYGGIKILIVRRTYPELLNNHVNPMKAILHGVAKYNKSEKMFTFPKKKGAAEPSTIKFGYCACDSDLDQYQGAEYDIIFLDEAGQLLQEWIEKINACVRGTNMEFPKRTYYTLNPGGPSHAYFKRLFVDRKFEADEDPDDYFFVQALVTDNEALMKAQPEYIKQLQLLPPKLRKAWLEGCWDIFEGQFFEDFRVEPDVMAAHEAGVDEDAEQLRKERRWCHVIDPFDIGSSEYRGWKYYRSYDFGYGKPFSCAWWAMDYDGVIYRIMELYGCTDTPNEGIKWTPDQQFREIARIEREHPFLRGREIRGVADPAIWDGSRGVSIAETAEKYGIYFEPGENDRIPGWMQVHYRFQFDENGYPRMYIFSNCKDFIRTIPQMMYSERKPEDMETTLEDHIADETRYFCMLNPVEPMRPVKQKEILSDPLNQFTKRR